MVTLAGYCVHSTVVPAIVIVPKFVFAPSEEIDGKELLFSKGGGNWVGGAMNRGESEADDRLKFGIH